MNLAAAIPNLLKHAADLAGVARDLAAELRRANDARERVWAIHWLTESEAASRLGMTVDTFRAFAGEHGIAPHNRQTSPRKIEPCFWAEQIVELLAIARRRAVAERTA